MLNKTTGSLSKCVIQELINVKYGYTSREKCTVWHMNSPFGSAALFQWTHTVPLQKHLRAQSGFMKRCFPEAGVRSLKDPHHSHLCHKQEVFFCMLVSEKNEVVDEKYNKRHLLDHSSKTLLTSKLNMVSSEFNRNCGVWKGWHHQTGQQEVVIVGLILMNPEAINISIVCFCTEVDQCIVFTD